MSNNKSSVLEIAVSFVIGAAAGYIVGILFAPAGGKKTRQKIQKEINTAGEKVKETYEKIAEEAEKGIEVLSKHLKT